MTTTPELINLHRAAAAAIEHVLEKTDQLDFANAYLLDLLDRAAGLEAPQEADSATCNARGLLLASQDFVANVAALRPIQTTGWR